MGRTTSSHSHHHVPVSASFLPSEYNPHRQRRVKVIVEEMVDGVVVSSSVDEKLQEMA